MLIKGNQFLLTSFSFVLFVAAFLSTTNLLSTAYGQSKIFPFDAGNIVTQHNTSNPSNLSNLSVNEADEPNPCNMPPCPPGHACIQSCPQ